MTTALTRLEPCGCTHSPECTMTSRCTLAFAVEAEAEEWERKVDELRAEVEALNAALRLIISSEDLTGGIVAHRQAEVERLKADNAGLRNEIMEIFTALMPLVADGAIVGERGTLTPWIIATHKKLADKLAAERARADRLTSAVRWALGYDEGPPEFMPPDGASRYWWREELRRRAGNIDAATVAGDSNGT